MSGLFFYNLIKVLFLCQKKCQNSLFWNIRFRYQEHQILFCYISSPKYLVGIDNRSKSSKKKKKTIYASGPPPQIYSLLHVLWCAQFWPMALRLTCKICQMNSTGILVMLWQHRTPGTYVIYIHSWISMP